MGSVEGIEADIEAGRELAELPKHVRVAEVNPVGQDAVGADLGVPPGDVRGRLDARREILKRLAIVTDDEAVSNHAGSPRVAGGIQVLMENVSLVRARWLTVTQHLERRKQFTHSDGHRRGRRSTPRPALECRDRGRGIATLLKDSQRASERTIRRRGSRSGQSTEGQLVSADEMATGNL